MCVYVRYFKPFKCIHKVLAYIILFQFVQFIQFYSNIFDASKWSMHTHSYTRMQSIELSCMYWLYMCLILYICISCMWCSWFFKRKLVSIFFVLCFVCSFCMIVCLKMSNGNFCAYFKSWNVREIVNEYWLILLGQQPMIMADAMLSMRRLCMLLDVRYQHFYWFHKMWVLIEGSRRIHRQIDI